MTRIQGLVRFGLVAVAFAAVIYGAAPARAADIIADWPTVTLPPAPELKPVTLHGKTTALLILDLQAPSCTMAQRPRCVDSIPKIKALMDRARAAGALVAYTLPSGNIIDPGLAPHEGEVVAQNPAEPTSPGHRSRQAAQGPRHQDRDHYRHLGAGRRHRHRQRLGAARLQRDLPDRRRLVGECVQGGIRRLPHGRGRTTVVTKFVTVTRSDMIKF